jgi:peptidoglycan/LPS O-acetylase OafA/YrhL
MTASEEQIDRQWSQFASGGRFSNLDGLRALAVALVFMHHLPAAAGSTFAHNGRYGVSIFFVLSGFLIASLIARDKARHRKFDMAAFLGRRAIRIMPPYLLVLAIYVVLIFGFGVFSAANREIFLHRLPSFLTYTANLDAAPGVGPFFFSWSLAVEEQFYLLIAVLAAMANSKTLVAVAASLILVRVGVAIIDPTSVPVTVRAIEEPIWVGVILAHAIRLERIRSILSQLARPAIVCALIGAQLAALALWDLPHKHAWDAWLFYAYTAVVVGASALTQPVSVLSHRGVCHVGRVSYGIYLLHMLAIMVCGRLVPGPASAILAALAVVSGATLMHRTVEQPLALWHRRTQVRRRGPVLSS